MDKQRIYPLLLTILILASFFHVQAIVVGIAIVIIGIGFNQNFGAIKKSGFFAVLLLPVIIGLISGYQNNNYLILKDIYYFSLPVLFVWAGTSLACKMEIPQFLRTLVITGIITSLIVTIISVSYMGLGSLTDPYSAHYAIGIVGTPVPPIALGCLILTKKFNIKLFVPFWFNVFVAINAFGIYMFASRTYLIITLCLVLLIAADRIRWTWLMPLMSFAVIVFVLIPSDAFKAKSEETFTGKLMGSFSEISLGDYNTEQDINIRYRGYESFMALKGFQEGTTKDWVFGGLGKLINLRTFVRLGEDTDYQFIPVLHNGWLYILVKTGFTGIITYLFLIFRLIFINWRRYADAKSKPIIRLFAAFIIGCTLSLALTNYVVSAFFNVEMSIIMITLGYSYINMRKLLFKLKEREEQMSVETAEMMM